MHAGSFLPQSRFFRVLAIVAVAVVITLSALTVVLQRHREATTGHADHITIAAPATDGSPDVTDGVLITHLEITGTSPKKTSLTVALTDMKGRLLPINVGYGVQFAARNLNTGATIAPRDMDADQTANTPTFTLDDPGLEDEGWWEFTTTITRPDGGPVASDFYLLLPDPNLAGFNAPPAPETDSQAAEQLDAALDRMGSWTSLRRWEWLSGGNDSLIMDTLAVTTTAANGQPDSFQTDMLFAGGFERRDDGAPPPVPATNHYTSITIGDQAWSRNAQGEVQQISPARNLPLHRYPETYQGAVSIQAGIEDEVNDRSTHIITFHVPTQPSQSEAWFAFWIDDESDDVIKVAMIASNHYMLWHFSDIDDDFVITPPEGAPPAGTPSATPVGTPAA